MAKETTTSQSQQNKSKDAGPSAIPPIPGWAEGCARIEAMIEQMAGWEQQAIDRATDAAEQSAQLAKTGLEYIGRLNDAWRQMAIDAARQGAQIFQQGH